MIEAVSAYFESNEKQTLISNNEPQTVLSFYKLAILGKF